MIRFDADDLISLPSAAGMLPGNVSPSTVWRWALKGRNGVRLQTLKIGRTRYTTKAELQKFLRESDVAANDTVTPRVHVMAVSDADRFLDEEGL